MTCQAPPMRILFVTALLAGVLISSLLSGSQAADDFMCAANVAVYGREIAKYQSYDAAMCQKKCQEAGIECSWFTIWEETNKNHIADNPDALCVLFNNDQGIGAPDYREGVLLTCAPPLIYPTLNIPAKHQAEQGTLIPTTTSGLYRVAAYSTGIIAVSVTMIPLTNKIVMFGRPQDPFSNPQGFPPQPGMAIPGDPTWNYPTSVADSELGTYEPVQSQPGSPFCAHSIHLSNGAVLVCGGDDEWIGDPGVGDWGGHKGCRTFSQVEGTWTWTQIPDMLGGNWYPSILEIPHNVGGSTGTCGLVLGGVMSYKETPASHASLACPQDNNLVFSVPVGNMGPAPIPANLGIKFPGAFLLPVGAPPAAPTISLTGHRGGGNVVTLNVNLAAKTMSFTAIKGLPEIPTPNAKLSSGLTPLAFDIVAGGRVNPATVELIAFGGEGTTAGEPSLNKAYRIRPLIGGPVWSTEDMPSGAHERMSVVLPNGKIVLVGGARQGHAGGLNRCCYSVQSQPILTAWMYDPYAPAGERFTIDTVMTPQLRFYHSNAWLGVDGDVLIAGSDQAVDPGYRPVFLMERYTPPTLRKAMATLPRPVIATNFNTATYKAVLAVQITGGYVSRCSLVKPAAVTHNSTPNQRVIRLITKANKVKATGGTISVQLPASSYTAPQGYWVLHCWDGDMYTAGKWLQII